MIKLYLIFWHFPTMYTTNQCTSQISVRVSGIIRQIKLDLWYFTSFAGSFSIHMPVWHCFSSTLFLRKVGTHWSIKSLSWVISMYEGRKSAFSYSDDKISIVWKKTWQRSLNWVSEVEIAEIFKAFYLIRKFKPDEIKVGIDNLLYFIVFFR